MSDNPYASSESLEKYLQQTPHSRFGLASLACAAISGLALLVMVFDVAWGLAPVEGNTHSAGIWPLMIYVICTASCWILGGGGGLLALMGLLQKERCHSSAYLGLALNCLTPLWWFGTLGMAHWLTH